MRALQTVDPEEVDTLVTEWYKKVGKVKGKVREGGTRAREGGTYARGRCTHGTRARTHVHTHTGLEPWVRTFGVRAQKYGRGHQSSM